jgi:Protein of unknown function (DUF1570)
MKSPVAVLRCALLMAYFTCGLCPGNVGRPSPMTAQAGESARMVELSDQNSSYEGKLVAKTPSHVCIMDRFGLMTALEIKSLKSFKVVAGSYSPVSSIGLQQSLKKELPPGYEIAASAHYVVMGRKGKADDYAKLFEEVYRQVDMFFSVRGFDTHLPEMPMVAFVFGTQAEFKAYCEAQNDQSMTKMRGYYSPKTNRVAMYEDPNQVIKVTAGISDQELMPPIGEDLFASVTGQTADVIIHEGTHQVGFNVGIHSRLGTTPRWIVEGLATVLEPPGIRSRGKAGKDKVNDERLSWFQGDYSQRRKPGDLAKMIASDDAFTGQTLDAYSLAWGMTYFLTENPARAGKFAKYLKKVSDRNPLYVYSAKDRLSDFQEIFGDISRVEVDLLRTIERMDP